MNPTKKKSVAKKKKATKKNVSKKGQKLIVHLEADVLSAGELASDGSFHVEGNPLALAALIATAMDTSSEFKRIVSLAVSSVEKVTRNMPIPSRMLLEDIIEELGDPMNHVGHGCDFDPKKKSPKKKTTKKSK